jgi:chromosome segregation ATPase
MKKRTKLKKPITTVKQEGVVTIPLEKYNKLKSDIRDLSSAVDALTGVNEEIRALYKDTQKKLRETKSKYDSAILTIKQLREG